MTDFYYIVTGPHRSGTSMMMRTLRDSGMPVNYVAEADYQLINAVKLVDKSYAPNPLGFFEKGKMEPGKVVKRIAGALLTTKLLGPTHIVCMSRAREERKASLSKWGFKGFEMLSRLDTDPIIKFNKFFNKEIASFTVVNYADMLEDPERQLKRLVKAGWPLVSIEEGAKVPTFDLYRHRSNAYYAQL